VPVKHASLKQFIKYLLVGLLGILLDFGIYIILTRKFNFSPVPANLISVFIAIVNNFLWNKYITFKARDTRQTGREFSKYFIINILSYTFQQVALPLLLLIPLENVFSGHQDLVIKGTLAFIVGLITYLINRNWTFYQARNLS